MILKDSWLINRPIAHRGLHNETIPENSIEAFANAINNKYPIELDIRMIDDGTLIIFHDETLGRMTKRDGYVSKLKESDLDDVKLHVSGQKIPTLQNVLDIVAGQVPLLIEIKHSGSVGPCESKLLELLKSYKGDFAIQSFNPYSVGFFAEHAPDILRGQLSTFFQRSELSFAKAYFLKRLKLNKISKPDFITYNVKYLPNKYVSRTNLPVIGWTVRSNSEYAKVNEFCDNIIFEGFIPKL